MAFVCITLPILVALHLGQDVNWDLANYHLYNPHAWLSGRYELDIAAAQLQSWHNPTLDIPLYLLVRADMPGWLVTSWLTVPAILALFAGTRLLENLLGRHASAWEIAVVAIVAISAPTMFSTVGSSMNDGFVAAGMVGALAIASSPGAGWRHWLLAGSIAGATAGLKLSGMAYCIGLFAAAIAVGPIRKVPVRTAALAAGGLLGFLLAYGTWGWRLWEAHGNPFFPYFNQVFHSPDVAAWSWADGRFRPDGVVDALVAPARLLFAGREFSEITVRTPLLLLGLLSIVGLQVHGARSGSERRDAVMATSAFFAASLAIWSFQSGILRYTSPLEVIAPALLMAALQRVPRSAYKATAVLLALGIVAFTVRPNWGRQPFQRHVLVADWPTLPSGSLVLRSDGAPLGYVALGLPRDIPIVAIRNNFQHPKRCQGLQQRAEARIRSHAGPMWLLEQDRDDADNAKGRRMARRFYGLVVGDACLRMRSTFGPIRLCPLARVATPPVCGGAQQPATPYMRPAKR